MKKMLIAGTVLALMASCASQPGKDVESTPPPTTTVQMPVDTQVIFSLSMLANIPASTAFGRHNITSASTAIQDIINYSSPKIDSVLQYASAPGVNLSVWKRVWGPGVAVNSGSTLVFGLLPPYVASASLTIFQDNNNNYVLAIQATNPNCNFDWDTYDFNVEKAHQWIFGGDSSGYVSEGTYLGFNALLGLTSGNTSAISFLNKAYAANSAINVVVTGHSLGGALSPVMALYLKHQFDSIARQNTTNVYCLSTAGATPGDADFAKYYNSKLMSNTMRVWNYLDVVPRAWDSTTMAYVESGSNGTGGIYSAPGNSTFYDSNYTAPCNVGKKVTPQPLPFKPLNTPSGINTLVKDKIAKAKKAVDKNGKPIRYTFICNGGYYFTGAQPDAPYLYVAPDSNLSAWYYALFHVSLKDSAFLPQAAAQHVDAYSIYYKIQPISAFLRKLIQSDSYSVPNWPCRSWNDKATAPAAKDAAGQAPPSNPDPYHVMMQALYKAAWKW